MKFKSVLSLLTLSSLLVFQSASTVKAQTWDNSSGGCATDIGAGSDSSVWVLGCKPGGKDGYDVWRWDGKKWDNSSGGKGERIAVSPEGIPWVVAANKSIWTLQGGRWQEKSQGACASDIGVGKNNAVWIVSCKGGGTTGYDIKKWTGTGWQTLGSAGEHIAVSPDGIPWVVDRLGNIFRRNGDAWINVKVKDQGCARDIGVGNNNSVWVLGCKPGGDDGYDVFKWTSTKWEKHGRGGERIAVSPGGVPWVVGQVKQDNIWRYR